MKPFVHLHNHSAYSVLDGAAKIDAMVEAAVRDGAPALGVTDHGVLYGLPDFYRACKSADINPVLGCEIYFADDRFDKSKDVSGNYLDGTNKRYYHLTILAENNTGYQNLLKLSSDAYLNGFYFKPRADWETIERYKEGLIVTSGCLGGPVLQKIMHGDINGAYDTVARLIDIFGPNNFFIELQDHGLKEQAETNPHLIDIAKHFSLRTIATNDSHYVEHDDHVAHDALLCVQTNSRVADTDRFKFQSDQHYLKSAEEMRHLFRWNERACDATLDIGNRANVTLDFDTLHIPHFEVPENFTEGTYLAALSKRGLEKRYGGLAPQFEQRLQYELSTIEQMGLSAYFLIVWDICRFADQNGVGRGPARGSVAGSLVAYCLNISKVDPMRHDLLFERFLNPHRIAMPDIDLDFSPRDRDKVINYVSDKYGATHVAQIITFGTIKARTAVRDSARVLGRPPKLGDVISKMMPEMVMGEDTPLWACLEDSERYHDRYNHAAELRRFYERDADAKETIDVAAGLEGLIRQDGVHAAGLLITPGPVTDYVPIQQKGEDAPIVTQYEKNTLEDLGLLKMDFLGLRNLDVITDTLRFLDDPPDMNSDNYRLFNDGPTFELLRSGDTVGVFQLESGPMADLLRAVNPNSIDDIAAVNALYRPGPMGTGMHTEYADRKNNRSAVTYFHEDAKDILDYTYGLMIYQEQAMQMAVRFAGYTEAEADNLRKIIGKKLVDKMAAEKAKFVQGCVDTGYGAQVGEDLFHNIESFASYGFNKSHAYGYAYLSYDTAYLKAHYPVEYMTALAGTVAGDTPKCAKYLSAARNMRLTVKGPNINHPSLHFVPDESGVVIGLGAVKFLRHDTAEKIVSEYEASGPFKSVQDFVIRIDPNLRDFQALAYAGALDDIGPRRGLAIAANEILTQHRRLQKGESTKQTALFDNMDHWEIEVADVEFGELEKLYREKDVFGIYVTGNPIYQFMNEWHTGENLESIAEKGEVLVSIMDITRKKTRNGAKMAILVVGDEHTTAEVVVFPRQWGQLEDQIKENDIGIMDIDVIHDPVTDDAKFVCDFFAPVSDRVEIFSEDYDTLILRLPRGFAANEMALAKLKGIMGSHPGKNPVSVQVSAKTEVDLKADFRVDWNDELKNEIASLFKRYSADKRMK